MSPADALKLEAAEAPRGRRRRGARSRPVSDINVTPFVDVMMVLLVVFMVAAPLLTVGVPLELPRTAAAPLPVDREEPLTVNVDAEGQIYLQREPIAFGDLVPALRALAAERTSERVFLRADAAIDYGRVAQVMGALNAGGFRDIGLVTDPAGEAEQGSAFRPAG